MRRVRKQGAIWGADMMEGDVLLGVLHPHD